MPPAPTGALISYGPSLAPALSCIREWLNYTCHPRSPPTALPYRQPQQLALSSRRSAAQEGPRVSSQRDAVASPSPPTALPYRQATTTSLVIPTERSAGGTSR